MARQFPPSAVEVYEGFSWPCFFFGTFWFMFKKMWGWAFLYLFIALIMGALSYTVSPDTYNIFDLPWFAVIFGFISNGLHTNHLIKKGYTKSSELS